MSRVLTNTITLEVAAESTLATQPTTGWKTIEPTTIGKFGPTLTKLTRTPISKNRQHRKGALTDLDSSVEFDLDMTYDHTNMFIEGLLFASAIGATTFTVTAVTATGFTVASGGAVPDGTLFFVRGCGVTANNGLHVAAGTSTGTEIKCTSLTAETPSTLMTLEICGWQAAATDLSISSAGNLVSAAVNWTSHAIGALIKVGQFVWVGYVAGDAFSFAISANRGLARVTAKSATTLTLDKKATTFATDAGTGKTVRVLFGRLVRNVAVGDTDYIERTYHFELGYENLAGSGSDKYEYAKGNFANEITFDFPVAGKATMKCNFVGTDTDAPTVTRATGADTPTITLASAMMNTSVNFLRLRATAYDETSLTADFKSMTIMVKNNVTPEKVLGTLGGKYMNAGMFDVEASGQVLFTDSALLAAMRANDTVTLEACVRNDEGAFVFDLPALTIEGGDKEFPVNQTVSIAMKSTAFQDPRLGSSIMVSIFPHLPAA